MTSLSAGPITLGCGVVVATIGAFWGSNKNKPQELVQSESELIVPIVLDVGSELPQLGQQVNQLNEVPNEFTCPLAIAMLVVIALLFIILRLRHSGAIHPETSGRDHQCAAATLVNVSTKGVRPEDGVDNSFDQRARLSGSEEDRQFVRCLVASCKEESSDNLDHRLSKLHDEGLDVAAIPVPMSPVDSEFDELLAASRIFDKDVAIDPPTSHVCMSASTDVIGGSDDIENTGDHIGTISSHQTNNQTMIDDIDCLEKTSQIEIDPNSELGQLMAESCKFDEQSNVQDTPNNVTLVGMARTPVPIEPSGSRSSTDAAKPHWVPAGASLASSHVSPVKMRPPLRAPVARSVPTPTRSSARCSLASSPVRHHDVRHSSGGTCSPVGGMLPRESHGILGTPTTSVRRHAAVT